MHWWKLLRSKLKVLCDEDYVLKVIVSNTICPLPSSNQMCYHVLYFWINKVLIKFFKRKKKSLKRNSCDITKKKKKIQQSWWYTLSRSQDTFWETMIWQRINYGQYFRKHLLVLNLEVFNSYATSSTYTFQLKQKVECNCTVACENGKELFFYYIKSRLSTLQ